jgi:Protein of unknown function (DUF732)
MKAVAGLAFILAAVTSAGAAHADGHDDTFWKFLQQQAIASAFTSEAEAIATARAACNLLAGGISTVDVSEGVKQNHPGLTGYQAGVFVGAGASAYCPNTWRRIQPNAYRTDVPGSKDIICQQLQLGESPLELAQLLHNGDPRYSTSQWITTIYIVEGTCD